MKEIGLIMILLGIVFSFLQTKFNPHFQNDILGWLFDGGILSIGLVVYLFYWLRRTLNDPNVHCLLTILVFIAFSLSFVFLVISFNFEGL